MQEVQLIESDIVTKIQNSSKIEQKEKESFLHLIMYFTPIELEELKLII